MSEIESPTIAEIRENRAGYEGYAMLLLADWVLQVMPHTVSTEFMPWRHRVPMPHLVVRPFPMDREYRVVAGGSASGLFQS